MNDDRLQKAAEASLQAAVNMRDFLGAMHSHLLSLCARTKELEEFCSPMPCGHPRICRGDDGKCGWCAAIIPVPRGPETTKVDRPMLCEEMERHLRERWATHEELIVVDSTSDEEYPIRILEAYLQSNQGEWTNNLLGTAPDDPVLMALNKASEERRKILTTAIGVLRTAKETSRPEHFWPSIGPKDGGEDEE